MPKKRFKKQLFRRGTPAYYAGVTLGSLLIAGVLAIIITMFLTRPRLTDKDFEVSSEAASIKEESTKSPVPQKKQQFVQPQRRNIRKKNLTIVGGKPSGSKFNLTCYSYVLDRCDRLNIDSDLCKPMAVFAAKTPASKGMKYCKRLLEENFPEYKKMMLKHVETALSSGPKTRTKKQLSLPNNIQVVNEAGEVIHKAKKRASTPNISQKEKKSEKSVLSMKQRKEILKKAYILMNRAHRASLTYSESPAMRKARLLKLKALISRTKDKDLKRAYNDLLQSVNRNSGRPSGYGVRGSMSTVRSSDIDHPQGTTEPKDLRIIREKMREANVKPPDLNQQPLERPVQSTAKANNMQPAQGTLPEAAAATPIQ